MGRVFALVALLAILVELIPTALAADYGVVLAGRRHFFWRTMTEGIESAATDLGVEVVIRSPVEGAAIESQRNVQLQFIDYLVSRGVEGILLAPEALEGVRTPVPAKVPTVLVDRSSTDYEALCLVATDNFAAGKIAARSLTPVLSAGARVAILRLAPDVTSTTQREEGFLTFAIESGWQIVIDTYVGHGFRESYEMAAEALGTHRGQVDAVFAPNEATAYGALQAVAEMPAEERPLVVAFDWRPEFMNAIRQGALYATVVQDAYGMGYRALETLVAATKGRTLPAQVSIDVMTVTQENLEDEAVQTLLNYYNN